MIRFLTTDHVRTLPNRSNLFRLSWSWHIILTLASWLAAVVRTSAATTGADAVVLVNSTSARYSDFQRMIQPYLENFGVPYTVQDIATNASTTNLTNFALVIIGHKQLDTN